jgi:uncharacterized damage-inducible protein DinB
VQRFGAGGVILQERKRSVMMQRFFEALLDRFQELHAEIEKSLEELPSEALDWVAGPEMNSLSVLIVHLSGAERYWIGDVTRGDPSNRNRDAEFQVKGVDAAYLSQRLKELDAYEKTSLAAMDIAELEQQRISPRDGRQYSVAWALTHALEHTAIHVGHIQILSQLWKQNQQG